MKNYLIPLILLLSFQFATAQNSSTLTIPTADERAGFVITEEGERIEVRSFGSVEKGDTKLSFTTSIKNKIGKTKKKNMKLDNFKQAESGLFKYLKMSVDGKKPRVYVVYGETSQYVMLTQNLRKELFGYTYYFLVKKNSNKLVKKGEFT